ncbi:TolB-like translocation protein [Streptomyces sp. NPDC089799]|uniref:TolB-like translocation protein n=1 Tax=Streptomyces sp. NPDC089799 TaxID=3155066 RepID=UPI003413B564
MTTRRRLLVLFAAVSLLAVLAGTAVLRAADRAAEKDRVQEGGPGVARGAVSLATGGERRIAFRNMAWGPHRDELTTVPADRPDGPRTASGISCLRFHAAGGTGVCLQPGGRAVVLDTSLKELSAHRLAGVPTRARVSPGGHLAAWTVFVGGDSYAGTDFSTRTSLLDLRTGRFEESLEAFSVRTEDGREYRAADVNFWGVTFTPDERGFYATLATGGRTHLVRGDLASRTVGMLRENVECPSLSPDGTRLVFKKRVPGLPAEAPWRLYALDLASGRETPLAETRSVDDQVVWTETKTVAGTGGGKGPGVGTGGGAAAVVYALPGDFGADLYTVPADGSGAPRRLMSSALAPAFMGTG